MNIPEEVFLNGETYSVTSIGSNAFYTRYVKSVLIPNSVTSIKKNAFSGYEMPTLIIGTGIKNIEIQSDFDVLKCICLAEIPPSGFKNIDANVYYVPNNKYPCSNAYPYLNSYFEVDNVIYLPVNMEDRICDVIACNYAPTSPEIIIGNKVIHNGVEWNVRNIRAYSFNSMDKISKVKINNDGYIGRNSFSFSHGLKSGYINNKGYVGENAFEFCELSDLFLGDGVVSIKDGAFEGCDMSQVIIPDNVKSIGEWSFSCCYKLSNVVLGKGVEFIGSSAFDDEVNSIISLAIEPPVCAIGALEMVNKQECKLYVPKESINKYKEAYQWEDFFNIEELSVEDVIADSQDYSHCPKEIYNLYGVKVGDTTENLAPGMYIVRQGKSCDKIVIK